MPPDDKLQNVGMMNLVFGKDEAMQVPVSFDGGPLHGESGFVTTLDQVRLFFDVRERKVYFYKRTDELQYQFDLEVSNALTAKYDEVLERFGGSDNAVSWEKPPKT